MCFHKMRYNEFEMMSPKAIAYVARILNLTGVLGYFIYEIKLIRIHYKCLNL